MASAAVHAFLERVPAAVWRTVLSEQQQLVFVARVAPPPSLALLHLYCWMGDRPQLFTLAVTDAVVLQFATDTMGGADSSHEFASMFVDRLLKCDAGALVLLRDRTLSLTLVLSSDEATGAKIEGVLLLSSTTAPCDFHAFIQCQESILRWLETAQRSRESADSARQSATADTRPTAAVAAAPMSTAAVLGLSVPARRGFAFAGAPK